eukprot:6173930-Pleurochrysis_carterae.AAC.1
MRMCTLVALCVLSCKATSAKIKTLDIPSGDNSCNRSCGIPSCHLFLAVEGNRNVHSRLKECRKESLDARDWSLAPLDYCTLAGSNAQSHVLASFNTQAHVCPTQAFGISNCPDSVDATYINSYCNKLTSILACRIRFIFSAVLHERSHLLQPIHVNACLPAFASKAKTRLAKQKHNCSEYATRTPLDLAYFVPHAIAGMVYNVAMKHHAHEQQ